MVTNSNVAATAPNLQPTSSSSAPKIMTLDKPPPFYSCAEGPLCLLKDDPNENEKLWTKCIKYNILMHHICLSYGILNESICLQCSDDNDPLTTDMTNSLLAATNKRRSPPIFSPLPPPGYFACKVHCCQKLKELKTEPKIPFPSLVTCPSKTTAPTTTAAETLPSKRSGHKCKNTLRIWESTEQQQKKRPTINSTAGKMTAKKLPRKHYPKT